MLQCLFNIPVGTFCKRPFLILETRYDDQLFIDYFEVIFKTKRTFDTLIFMLINAVYNVSIALYPCLPNLLIIC